MNALIFDIDNEPTARDIRLFSSWLADHGYAIIVWTPKELDKADPEDVEVRCIRAGWDLINAQNTTETQ